MQNTDLLFSLVAGIAIGLWIYGDAQDRKLKDAVIWGMVGLLFSAIGFVVYWILVIRPDKRG
jgi:hypothetical protein